MNIFNGRYLECYVDETMKKYINSLVGSNIVEVYNKHKIKVLLEANKVFIIPIGLFSNSGLELKCKWKNTDRVFNHEITNISSNIVLKNKQHLIINEFLKHRDIIMELNKAPIYLNIVGHCSIGKTVMAIHLIHTLKLKTFIITPSLELAKQWGKEINKFLDVNCYVSLRGVKNFFKENNTNYDVLCFPYKHLTDFEFHEYLMNNYSMGIIDEQHKYNLFSNDILQYFLTFCSFKTFISLTATPRNYNKLFLGREINMDKFSSIVSFEKIAYEVLGEDFKHEPVSKAYSLYKNLKNYNNYIPRKDLILSIYKKRACASDMYRNQIIVNCITKSFAEDSKILVLTKFVEDIDKLYQMLILNKIQDQYLFKIYALDKNNDKALINVKKNLQNYSKYIIIGTEDHLGTGIDIVELNVLHLTSITTNVRNIIQYAGRVSRENITPIHYIYYYNICSLKNLNIETEISIMRKTLSNNNWSCMIKKYL